MLPERITIKRGPGLCCKEKAKDLGYPKEAFLVAQKDWRKLVWPGWQREKGNS